MSDADLFDGPVFLIGHGRSGTKLLRAILTQNNAIAIADVETNFLCAWVRKKDKFPSLMDEDVFHAFYRSTIKLPYFLYRRSQGLLISEHEWRTRIREYSVAGVFEALIRHDCGIEQPGIIWGDKSPNYTRCVAQLKSEFPKARFVHIVRDVRDVALSANRAWKSNPIRAAQRWSDSVLEPSTQAALFRNDLLEVKYEELIERPVEVVTRICEFLGVRFYPDMLNLKQSPENLGDAKGINFIVDGNKDKGIRLLDRRVTERIESIAGNGLRHFGYQAKYEGRPRRVSKIQMAAYRLADGYHHLRREVTERGFAKGVQFVARFFLQNIRAGL